jgi:hypothetical protein
VEEKLRVSKARRKKLGQEARIKKGNEEEGTDMSLENFCAGCSSSAVISDQRRLASGFKKA